MAAIKVEWTHITILSVIAFVAGWFIFRSSRSDSIGYYRHGVNGNHKSRLISWILK